jgi:AcrR family transcriptional regulator
VGSRNTQDRIIEAAERLFADSGFSGTSLRQLTSLAEVNLAAVNYHFGSKENLINEVFRRRLDILHGMRLQQLDALQETYAGQTPPLRQVLKAFINPALHMSVPSEDGQSAFVKVLARAYVEYRDDLRSLLATRYGELNHRFFEAIAANLPQVTEQQLVWRIDFMIGALTYAMADFGVKKRPDDMSDEDYWSKTVNELVQFAEAGLIQGQTTSN